jgi:AcrR family transcriptional regulator
MQDENNPKPRRRNTKERIIDEAEALAAFHGIEHLKLQDVADKIGIKLPSVYAHFSGREDILHAMSARIHRALTQLFICKTQDDPRESLRKGSADLVSLMIRNPSYFRLMLRDLSVPLGYDPVNRRYSSHHGQSVAPEMKDLIERVKRQLESLASTGSPAMSAESFVATLLGSLLVSLSWREWNPAQSTDETELQVLKQQIASLTDNLLKQAIGAGRNTNPEQDKRA